MKRKRKLFRKIVNLILFTILFFLLYAVGGSVYENIKKNEMVNEFKSRAYETNSVTIANGDVFTYHKVKRVHDYELIDERNVFYDANKMYPGIAGDVLLAFESPFPYVPVVHQLLSFWLGGHAAMVVENNRIVQSTGMAAGGGLNFDIMFKSILNDGYDDDNEIGVSAQKVSNYWLTPYRNESHKEFPFYGSYYRPEIFAVRPKYRDISKIDDDINELTEFMDDKIDRALYNYLFIFDTKDKYYCTDLVTRAFVYVNEQNGTDYNLDEDGFIPSDYDILLSKDVYITIYKETIDNEIHIYYLEDF